MGALRYSDGLADEYKRQCFLYLYGIGVGAALCMPAMYSDVAA